ncbi:membrane hypothetical protein [Mesorhizobium sp. SOD10]|nr:membrane hypothetical protein [Mesorhizobium sp. SOD10]
MRDLDFGAGGLNLVTRQGVDMTINIGGACRTGAAVLAAVAVIVPVPVIAAAVSAIAVSVIAAAISVAVSVVAAAISVAVPVIAAAVTVSVAAAITVAIAAFAGIGFGHDRAIEGETERRDNKRQRGQRSQDQPAATAL